jgi:CMP-N-acetylneuraminic acid synthetase
MTHLVHRIKYLSILIARTNSKKIKQNWKNIKKIKKIRVILITKNKINVSYSEISYILK